MLQNVGLLFLRREFCKIKYQHISSVFASNSAHKISCNFLPIYFSRPLIYKTITYDKSHKPEKAIEIKEQPIVEPKNLDELPDEDIKDDKSLTRWEKFKLMMKRYWYVLIPVHAITTAFWLSSFWYAAKCGLDVVPLLEKLDLPEKFIEPLKRSGATYFATAYALYKLITPIRYAVTLGATTFAIKILKDHGLIKPVPSRKQIKKMVHTLREHRIKQKRKKKTL